MHFRRFLCFVFLTVFLIAGVSYPAGAAAPVAAPSGETEILWDVWGVPHIFAGDVAGAFRAFGWAQMYNHGNLMLELYAQARGRAAEYLGEDYLVSDRGVRTMGLYERAQSWYGQQSPEFRGYLDVFAQGANEYAEQNLDRLDDRLEVVLPVDGIDLMAHLLRDMYAFSSGSCSRYLPLGSSLRSNGWAIAPSHAEGENAMLLVNPHMIWGSDNLMTEAHIVAPGYNVTGATLVGMPVLAMAFNDNLGWTHTVNPIDTCDVYELTLSGDGYYYDGEVRDFDVRSDSIKVLQADGTMSEEPLELRRSVHGPVVEMGGRTYAIRSSWAGVVDTPGGYEQWWDMGMAQNLEEFEAVLRRMQIPMFNVIYADGDGHIMLLYNGQMPDRPGGDALFWSDTVPGHTSDLLWTDILPYDALPKAIDPPAGWVQNCNSAPWFMTEPLLDPGDYPPDLSVNWWNDPMGTHLLLNTREQRSLRMLKSDDAFSFEELVAAKFSTRSEMADRLLDELIPAAEQFGSDLAKEAAQVLAEWDRRTNPDSRGAALFHAWAYQLILAKMTPDARELPNPYAEPLDLENLIETPDGLQNPVEAVEGLEAAAQQLLDATGQLDVPYGEVFRLQRGEYDLPAIGGNWLFGTFRNIEFMPGPDGRFVAFGGDSFIAAVEFGEPLKAKVLLVYGNSTDPSSPHYGDQLPLYARNELRDAWRERADIEANLKASTRLLSDGTVTHTPVEP